MNAQRCRKSMQRATLCFRFPSVVRRSHAVSLPWSAALTRVSVTAAHSGTHEPTHVNTVCDFLKRGGKRHYLCQSGGGVSAFKVSKSFKMRSSSVHSEFAREKVVMAWLLVQGTNVAPWAVAGVGTMELREANASELPVL